MSSSSSLERHSRKVLPVLQRVPIYQLGTRDQLVPPGQIEGRLPEPEVVRLSIVPRFVLGYHCEASRPFQQLPAVLCGLRRIGLVSSPFSAIQRIKLDPLAAPLCLPESFKSESTRIVLRRVMQDCHGLCTVMSRHEVRVESGSGGLL